MLILILKKIFIKVYSRNNVVRGEINYGINWMIVYCFVMFVDCELVGLVCGL